MGGGPPRDFPHTAVAFLLIAGILIHRGRAGADGWGIWPAR